MAHRTKTGTIRGRLSDGAPNPIDIHVGSRVRMRRTMLGLSQEKLADELGVTFQQVQKYEKGLNRIGASRLWDFSQVLGVPVDFFYQNLDETSQNSSPRKITGGLGFLEEETSQTDSELLMRKDVLELMRYYSKIKDPKVAKTVLDLVKTLTASQASSQEEDLQS